MRGQKILYVLADGARARLVERSSETGHYVTLTELSGERDLKRLRAELRASPPVANRQSGTPQRHAVGGSDFFRTAKESFARSVAERAIEVIRERGFERVFVAAPARLLGPLESQFAHIVPLAGSIGRDLTKTPDARLGEWLEHVYPE